MAKKAQIEIIGLAEVQRMLDTLPIAVHKKVLNQGCRAVANDYLLKAARRNLLTADKSGLKLWKHVKTWPMKKTWRAGVWVGYRPQYDKKYESEVYTEHGGNEKRNKSLWAIRGGWWLEYGALGIGRHGKYAGIKFHPTKATGWFRRAVWMSINHTRKSFGHFVGRKIDAHIERAGLLPA